MNATLHGSPAIAAKVALAGLPAGQRVPAAVRLARRLADCGCPPALIAVALAEQQRLAGRLSRLALLCGARELQGELAQQAARIWGRRADQGGRSHG